jgi:hypothetical protein
LRHSHILVASVVVLVLISVHWKVVSLSIIHSLVVGVNSQVLVSGLSWAVWVLHTDLVLVVYIVSEHFLREETTTINVNLLLDNLLVKTKIA